MSAHNCISLSFVAHALFFVFAMETMAVEGRLLIAPRGWSDRSYFLDNNGLSCSEGPPDVVEGALALKKAGLLGELYNKVFAHHASSGMSCAQQGYTFIDVTHGSTDGSDGCYPGITVSYKDNHANETFFKMELAALDAYGKKWGLLASQVPLIHACTCHPESTLKTKAFMECSDVLNGMTGSWVHHNPVDQSELMCDGGPFLEATYALAILKTTAQLPMHQYDQIAPVQCDQLGFPYKYPPVDHCFAGLHIWTKTPVLETDEGIKSSQLVENGLFSGDWMIRFEGKYQLNHGVLNRVSGCQCSPHSSVGHDMGTACSQEGSASPIRGWWVEQ